MQKRSFTKDLEQTDCMLHLSPQQNTDSRETDFQEGHEGQTAASIYIL